MQVDVLEHAVQMKQKRSFLGRNGAKVQLDHHHDDVPCVEKENSDDIHKKEETHQLFLFQRRKAQMEDVKNYVQILSALKLRPGHWNYATPEEDPVFKIMLSILRKIEFENAKERRKRREDKRRKREERRKLGQLNQVNEIVSTVLT